MTFPEKVYHYFGKKGCAVVSKCANPECSERFRYLHQGKLFLLTPSPELQASADHSLPFLYERFWLCDSCSKTMTVAWGGTEVELIPLPKQPTKLESVEPRKPVHKHPLNSRAARV